MGKKHHLEDDFNEELRGEELNLSEEEEKALNAAWDEIWAENAESEDYSEEE